MVIVDVIAVLIALLSLAISLWVVTRDRRNRQMDLLCQCYDRLQLAHDSRPYASPSELIEMEEDPDDARWEEYKAKSETAQSAVDRELEFVCFLATKNHVHLESFFYLFRRWIASREIFLRSGSRDWRAKNNPYTVMVIRLCQEKKLLPIKSNPKLRQLQAEVDLFLSERGRE